MAGTYSAIDIGGGSGMLVFAVDDSPVAGVLINIDIGASGGGAATSSPSSTTT